uniref:Uncharacterized protein n=1 Tax=Solanum lycopersicum TaxID=4081 RepID=A0A3Q7JND5_SOLLC
MGVKQYVDVFNRVDLRTYVCAYFVCNNLPFINMTHMFSGRPCRLFFIIQFDKRLLLLVLILINYVSVSKFLRSPILTLSSSFDLIKGC